MTQFWGHRGASAHAPENTIEAFEKAIQMRVDGVELDVQRSRDGCLVVIHDETIDRTSTGSGRVVDLTLDDLRSHRYGNKMQGFEDARIPLLEEVFELFRSTGLTMNVELKTSIEIYPGIEDDALALAQAMGVEEQVLWSSFNHNTLAGLRGRVAREQIALLNEDALYEPWDYAARFGAGALHPGLHLLQQPGYVDAAHEAGLAVNVWTVNDPEHARLVLALGADAIITNYPERKRLVVSAG